MFGFRGGWVGQPKSEHCSDLEIRTKYWTIPEQSVVALAGHFQKKFRLISCWMFCPMMKLFVRHFENLLANLAYIELYYVKRLLNMYMCVFFKLQVLHYQGWAEPVIKEPP